MMSHSLDRAERAKCGTERLAKGSGNIPLSGRRCRFFVLSSRRSKFFFSSPFSNSPSPPPPRANSNSASRPLKNTHQDGLALEVRLGQVTWNDRALTEGRKGGVFR